MASMEDEATRLISSNPHPNEIPAADSVYSFDWSSTPLGPMNFWAPSLRATVDLCLNSIFPAAVYYGPEPVSICNQTWRKILGIEHPIGFPANEVCTEIYDVLRPLLEGVISTGKGQFNSDTLLLVKREGNIEECYLSFTSSPIFKEDRTVGGVFIVAQETTQRVLAARRIGTLGILENRTSSARSVESACHLVTSTLRDNNEDITFALVYIIDNHDKGSDASCKRVRLMATTFDEKITTVRVDDDGIGELVFVEGKSTRELPDFLLDTFDLVNLTDDENDINREVPTSIPDASNFKPSSWPIEQLARSNSQLIVTLKNGSRAILLPVYTSSMGKMLLTAIIICGLNQHRALDQEYSTFLQLVVSQVSLSLTNGRSREEEKKRVEILEDLNRKRMMFFKNINHELRTPLTLLITPLEEIISAYPSDVPVISNIQVINRNACRLLRLVKNLLQFSQFDMGRAETHFREVDITKFTLELASNFESVAKLLKLDYFIEIPSHEEFYGKLKSKVFVDKDMYRKILLNLCSNAFNHTWTGNVTVRLYPDYQDGREVVVLEISDTGSGIPENEIPNLFQHFYRVRSNQSRSYRGAGIGLTLVKELVVRHGGEISVRSEVKKGTTFRLLFRTGWEHLPRELVHFVADDFEIEMNHVDEHLFNDRDLYLESRQQMQDDLDNSIDVAPTENNTGDAMSLDSLDLLTGEQRSSSRTLYDGPPPIHGLRYCVLIIDDDNDMKIHLFKILYKEFDVYRVCHDHDILATLKKLPKLPDVILSDTVNDMDALRSDHATLFIPVISLSVCESAGVEELEKGADDYLIRPFCGRELIVRVRDNIKLSHLRRQLSLQHKWNSETRELLFSIINQIRSGFNIEETLASAVKQIHSILPSEVVIVINTHSEDPNDYYIMAAEPNCQNFVGRRVNNVINDADVDPSGAHFEPVKETYRKLQTGYNYPPRKNTYSRLLGGYVSNATAPIKTNSSTWGFLSVYRQVGSIWKDSEIEFIEQSSNQIGLAITHAMLIEEKLKKEAQMEAEKAANKAKGQILANTSHELRTPLGAIIGVLSAFEDTPLTKDQKEMVNIMMRASDVVLAVVNDILDAARLEAQKITLANKTFDLLCLVEETLEMFGKKAGSKKIELILCCEPTSLPKHVKSDPDRLQQVLINFLSNS